MIKPSLQREMDNTHTHTHTHYLLPILRASTLYVLSPSEALSVDLKCSSHDLDEYVSLVVCVPVKVRNVCLSNCILA